jgi:serine/threonine protein kinase
VSGPIETLDLQFGRGPLPLAKALRYGIDLAESLRDVHKRGRVCAFLQPAGVAIVKGRAGLGPLKATSISPYFSPEQVRGKDLDSRSDLFSLGAILYEMLSGHRAFPGESKSALRVEILERNPDPLENTPPALARLISQCLEKRPEQRLQRVDVLLAGLKLQYILICSPRSDPRAAAGVVKPRRAEPKLGPVPLPPGATEKFLGQASIANAADEYADARTTRFCPKCASCEVYDSRPKDWIERALRRFGVSVNRCHRCFYRFLYKFGIVIGRQGIVDD